ncbi:hypothetical protein QWY20_18105 [Alkalimonas sp. MEB108]|uniref:Peptidase C39-like domain-containing protein n=1 Tax=Alkalimonas cellulosilytica TaxID=3058395 RepID=A0ABU7JAJ2_9GAMM|nr:hypothetical protein [Alkalimonas sp. MEB108]MEE2003362.1 hypothetical protein [Alkalimonas sp. MEB108]
MSSKRIKPSKQGELDGACGFYAIVNAIRSLEPELSADELFTQVLKAYLLDGDPMSFVNGTRRGSIKNTLSRVISYLHENFYFTNNYSGREYNFVMKIPFWQLNKKPTRKEVLEIIKSANSKAGTVCIIGYDYNCGYDDYAHWSVITNSDENGVRFFDSSGESEFISFDLIRVDSVQSSNASRPYNIISGDIFVLCRCDLSL